MLQRPGGGLVYCWRSSYWGWCANGNTNEHSSRIRGQSPGRHGVRGTLGRKNIFGFGVKAVQFAAKRRAAKRYEKARHEHQEWLSYAAADESPETD